MKLNVSLRITVVWDVTPYSLITVTNQGYMLPTYSGYKSSFLIVVSKIAVVWYMTPYILVKVTDVSDEHVPPSIFKVEVYCFYGGDCD
jgi:hypothetical protein